MTSNTTLRSLHFERRARLGLLEAVTETVVEAPAGGGGPAAAGGSEPFECAVCYTDGSASGLVIPKCCNHKICLGCYTNIVLRSRSDDARCPECRTVFLAKGTVVTDSHDDDYSDMPPLISLADILPQRAHTELEAAHNLLRSLIYITATRNLQTLADIYPALPNLAPHADVELGAEVTDAEVTGAEVEHMPPVVLDGVEMNWHVPQWQDAEWNTGEWVPEDAQEPNV